MIVVRFLTRLVVLLAAASAAGWMFQVVHPVGLTWAGLAVYESEAPESTLQARPAPGEQEGVGIPFGTITHRLIEARWLNDGLPETAPIVGRVAPAAQAGVAELDWSEAMRRVEEGRAILVDVRSRSAFAAGHVPGAVSAPLEEMVAGDWGELEPDKVGDRHLVLYCSNVRCPQARQAARLLEPRFGEERLAHVLGGYFEWRMEKAGGQQ